MTDEPAKGPKKIGDLLGLILAKYGYGQSARRVALEKAWDEVADERTRLHTRLGSMKRGVLEVLVDSASLLADLEGFEKHALLEGLKERLGSKEISGLRFRRL